MNLWCDGLGRYGGTISHMLNGSSSQAWAEVTPGPSGGGFALSNANPRTGTWHLRLTDGGGGPIARRVFGDTLTEVFVGHANYFEILPVVEPTPGGNAQGFILAQFRDQTNTVMVSIYVGTDGAIVAYRAGSDSTFNGVLLGRSSPIVGAGAYMHFEHYLKVGNADGAYECRVNEVTVLNLTGIDTDTGGGEVSQFVTGRFTGPAFGATTKKVDFADFYANDTTADGSGCDTFIGDCKSGLLMVNGDTAQADFTLSSGVSGYALLDETPPNDTDNINTSLTTAESDFTLENGPANLSEILTTRPFNRAMKDDAGTCSIAPSMISNSVKATVSAQPITTAFAYYDSNVPFDPDTGVPWTPTGLNAALEVVERTA